MAKADRGIHVQKRRTKVTIVLPDQLDASIVTLPPSSPSDSAPHGEIHMARPQPTTGCIFGASLPTSTDASPSSVVVAKYTVTGDATSADSVTFKGGTTSSSFRLVPIFYGTAWLTSQPTNSGVNAAIRDLLLSPYLRELDQYGFSRLELLPPVLVNAAAPAIHTSDDAAAIVWSLIDAGAVPQVAKPPDAAIYVVFYPTGTSVSDISACGWHYSASGAWVAAVEFPDGGGSTAVTLNNIMRIFSHELVETITDPDGGAPGQGWVMDRVIDGGTEIGDACNSTDDFTAGVFVNAYWSERHKACIIPKPRGFVLVNSSVEIISETVVSNGTVTFLGDPFDIRTCLQGTYSFTNSFVAQRANFRASSTNFRTPTFSWKLMEAKPSPLVLSNGFNGTVLLSVDTWSDGPGTSTHAVADVPVHVDVAGAELTVVADSLGVDYVNFPVLVEATASEGAFTAAAYGRELLVCQKFEWDENYRDDLANCRQRLDKLVLQAIQLIPFIDKGDPVRMWVDGVSRWIGGERVTAAARAASVAAAIEAAHPELAVQLRGLASVVYQIPAALLSTTTTVATTER
jgi:hypothetical protein